MTPTSVSAHAVEHSHIWLRRVGKPIDTDAKEPDASAINVVAPLLSDGIFGTGPGPGCVVRWCGYDFVSFGFMIHVLSVSAISYGCFPVLGIAANLVWRDNAPRALWSDLTYCERLY